MKKWIVVLGGLILAVLSMVAVSSCSKDKGPIFACEHKCKLAFDCKDGTFQLHWGRPEFTGELSFPSWEQTYDIYNFPKDNNPNDNTQPNPKLLPWEIIEIESNGLSWKPGDSEDSLLKMGILEFKELPDYHYSITLSEWQGDKPRAFKVSVRVYDGKEDYAYWLQYSPGGEADDFFRNAANTDEIPIELPFWFEN